MKYGYFDDKRKEYVIETPETPLPWINYLGNDGFFSLISNTAGGYSFYRDAKLRRITRYRYNNVPADTGGRCFYIKDEDVVWSPSFLPAKTELDSYICRHGMGYTKFDSQKNNISCETTFFVPLGETCEVQMVSLKNESDGIKTISLFSAAEWCFWNTVDDSTNFQRNLNIGEVEIENSTLYHKTEYRERRNHYAFYSVNADIAGFDTDRDSFLGKFNGWDSPSVIQNGACTNSVASGWSPIAAHQIDITLEAGQSKDFVFVLGYIENNVENKWESVGVINKEKAHQMIEKFNSTEKANKVLDDLNDYWNKLFSNFQVTSSDEKLDRMANIWNQYQCMVTFNMSRSASYFESGVGRGMGFRDSCQDLLGVVHMIPKRARERIIDIASIQFEDGSTYHQYQPLTKRGNGDVGSGFNDDPLWLVACTAAYIRETGDSSILDELVPFNNKEGSEVPLMQHLRQSFNYVVTHKGPHDLPLIGRADWNDCLNLNCFSEEPGESFQTCSNFESGKAESIFIAGMFVKYGREYAELCERFGDKSESKTVIEQVEAVEKAVIKSGWDGEWFLRAYDAFENKIGSKECDEGKIYIEPQGFCVMAGIGGKEYGTKALDSVRTHLVNDYGVELLSPCYSTYRKELGEISSYPQGYKENGSIFCHNNPWIVLAYSTLGDGNGAFDIYRRNCPAYLEDVSEIHKTEPYVYSQTIAGREAKNYGQAKNSFLTGTAAWTFTALVQGIFGIIPQYDGLSITPCLGDNMDGFSTTRIYRGVEYDITVKRGQQKGMIVDGKSVEGNIIPIMKEKSCKVEITI